MEKNSILLSKLKESYKNSSKFLKKLKLFPQKLKVLPSLLGFYCRKTSKKKPAYLKEDVWLDVHQVRRVVPHVLPVVYDADHVVTTGEQRGQVGSLGLVVETLVPRKNTVGKVSGNMKSATDIHAFLQEKNVFNLECWSKTYFESLSRNLAMVCAYSLAPKVTMCSS